MVERITPEAWEGLQAEMRAGRIGGLHEAQAYLRDTWHIAYGIDAISKLFRRRKTKLKTGRPCHRKAARRTCRRRPSGRITVTQSGPRQDASGATSSR
jgi:hypothetical protein